MDARVVVECVACRDFRCEYFLLVLLTRLLIAIKCLYLLSDSKWHYYLEPPVEYSDVGFV